MKLRDEFNYRTCPVCEQQFKYGPHIYDGIRSHLYDMLVCRRCWSANWDGWAPHFESKLIKHIKEKGLPIPKRNAQGLFPRE